MSNTALLSLLGLAALTLVKLALVPAVAYLSAKLGSFLAAHTAKAQAQHKLVKLAEAEQSLGNFALAGLGSVAASAQADATNGKPLSVIASDAVAAAKKYAADNGLAEIQALLGITTEGLDAKLTAIVTPKAQALVAGVGTAGSVSPSKPVAA